MNHENKDQSGEMRPESEGERQVKVIPISTGVPAEITFIEINGERWVKRKEAIASYRTALKRKIEERIDELNNNINEFNEGDEYDDEGDLFTIEVLRGKVNECNKFLKLIDSES